MKNLEKNLESEMRKIRLTKAMVRMKDQKTGKARKRGKTTTTKKRHFNSVHSPMNLTNKDVWHWEA